jgi:cyanophycinase
VRHAQALEILTREDCQEQEHLDYIEKSDGIFLTGGNQLRLSTTLGGTPVAQMIRRRNAKGLHVAGTSAGAAFMPEHMIAGGDEGSTPSPTMVTMAPGLGLTNNFVIDQHFRQRDRLGRLLTALAYNPFAVGIGLDEDTAAFIRPGDDLEVVGSGGITIIDPTNLTYSSMDRARRGDPVSLIGVKLHILIAGGRFEIASRKATAE